MINEFSKSAKDLSKNPLGIIALFIVLVYGFACLLFSISSEQLVSSERMPIIYFVITFPIIVLVVFSWLVSNHHDKLYSPTDYREDSSFLKTTRNELPKQKVSSTEIENNLGSNNVSEEEEEKIKEWLNFGSGINSSKKYEDSITNDLLSTGLTIPNDDATKILLRHLSTYKVYMEFEDIYNTIFGTQAKILNIANSSDTKSISLEFTKSIFKDVKKEYSDSLNDWDFDTYMRYLITTGLVNTKDDSFYITEKCIDFISYLAHKNYNAELRAL